MISDEKRREVADKMRGYDVSEFKESAIVPFLECLGHGYTNWRGVLDELADLIDRPTCRNEEDSHGGTFLCSACGYEAYTYSGSNRNPHDFESNRVPGLLAGAGRGHNPKEKE